MRGVTTASGTAKSTEIFRRVKRGSLEVGQRQNLSIGPKV